MKQTAMFVFGAALAWNVWALPAMGGQAGKSPTPGQASPSAAQPAATAGGEVEFADEALRLESVGLSVRVPLGAEITSSGTGGNAGGAIYSASIRDAKRNWIINIAIPRTDNPAVTLEQAAQKTLMDRMMVDKVEVLEDKKRKDVASLGQVIDRIKNLKVPGCPVPGERFYISLPQGPTDRVVQGYTLFKISAQQFIAFELICGEALFPQARKTYEAMVAAIRVEDPETLDTRRREAIRAGVMFFSRLGPGDYEAAMAQPMQLYRLYSPAASGAPADAEERGYRTLRFFKGTRAQIDPKETDSRATPANPAGYLAEVRARLLDRGPAGDLGVTDVEGRYYMSEDRKEEAWSVRMVRKDSSDPKPLLVTETGTRSGTTMTVIVNKPGKIEPTVRPTVPPEGYINQVEVFMLPRLMVSSGAEIEMGSYAYNWITENVTMRRDELAQEATMPGVWKLTTRTREGAEPMISLYRGEGTTGKEGTKVAGLGELISAQLSANMAMEPIWPDELERLWKSKKLPTERMELPKAERKRGK